MKRRKILFENSDFLNEPKVKSNDDVVKKARGSRKKTNILYNLAVALFDNIAAIITTLIISAIVSLIVIAILNGDSSNIIDGIKNIFSTK